MASNVSFNGVTYSIPAEGDTGWGPDLTAYFISIASNAFQKTGGAFTLTAEADFGASFGLKTVSIKSKAANPAGSGFLRLGSAQSISWRNNANSADLALTTNASDALLFNSKTVLFSGLGLIVNADVSNSAAIAYSKLNLATSIVNGDISASAAIAYSKLNLATSIVNADVSASAAIAYSKLAALTASRALVSDGSGFVSVSSVTSAELGHLSGVTSAIQTQLNTKAPSASPTFTGTVTLPATVTGASAQVITLPTSTSTLATLGLTETITGAKTMQNLTVTTNALGLTVGQISFPASQNASAGANVLDDYEENTWTPGIAFGGGTTGITYTNQSGFYIKIGRVVTCWGRITLSNKGSSTGTTTITGLPFTSATNTGYGDASAICFGSYANMTSFSVAGGYVANNSTTAVVVVHGSATSTATTQANFNNTSDIYFTITYLAAS